MNVTNPRLFRLKEKTLRFRFTIKYLPGKRNSAADFLSHFPALKATDPSHHDVELDEELAAVVVTATIAAAQGEGGILDEESVRKAAADDPVCYLHRL